VWCGRTLKAQTHQFPADAKLVNNRRHQGSPVTIE
jgi:hypothetical protein